MNRTRVAEEQLIQNVSAYMRMKLAQNRHKPHWLDESEEALVDGLMDEWNELSQALLIYGMSPTSSGLEAIKQESADVHNYLEMLCDKLTRLRCHSEQSNAQTA
jgi:NTP pyrophosphatase (non-canonical NTP hydrolase)